MEFKPYWRAAAMVFLTSGSVLFGLCGNLLTLNVDEGIYLDGALRVMRGQAPYRDFFVHTGPGTYWLYGAVFRLAHPWLGFARLPLICEIAAVTAAVFFLTANLTTRAFGLATAAVFFALETHDLGMVALNHRWDSSALAFVAVAVAYGAIRSGSRPASVAAGMLAAASAWCTPTLGIVALTVALWLLFDTRRRKLLPAFVAGMAAVSALCAGILLAEGALGPMLEHFLWTGANYSASNRVPYGWAGTGYREIGSGLGIGGWILYSALLTVVSIPAILPLLALLAWTLYLAIRRSAMRDKPTLFLIPCSIALWLSTYPRWDIGHLLYTAPVFYVLAAGLLHRTLPQKAKPAVFAALIFLAIFAWTPVLAETHQRLQTPAGSVRISPADGKLLETVLSHVRPGNSLFVFPYFPTIYFLTQGLNPTHFSYLQPGLMTGEDEAAALAELAAHPPEWVLYDDVPPELILKHWPSSDPSRLRLNSIEQFLSANYHAVEKVNHRLGDFSLMRRGPD